MTLFVVRHAKAGKRGLFDGDDLLRPLDRTGQAQSRVIADSLKDRPIRRLLSSEATRCVQTLEPLGDELGLPIGTHEALLEGVRPARTVELLRELAMTGADAAVCSHRDVIPATIRLLAMEGTVLIGGQGCAKGSIWELDVRGRDIVSARYHPATTLSRDLAST